LQPRKPVSMWWNSQLVNLPMRRPGLRTNRRRVFKSNRNCRCSFARRKFSSAALPLESTFPTDQREGAQMTTKTNHQPVVDLSRNLSAGDTGGFLAKRIGTVHGKPAARIQPTDIAWTGRRRTVTTVPHSFGDSLRARRSGARRGRFAARTAGAAEIPERRCQAVGAEDHSGQDESGRSVQAHRPIV